MAESSRDPFTLTPMAALRFWSGARTVGWPAVGDDFGAGTCCHWGVELRLGVLVNAYGLIGPELRYDGAPPLTDRPWKLFRCCWLPGYWCVGDWRAEPEDGLVWSIATGAGCWE